MTAAATSAAAKAKTLHELRKFDGPLFVQNNTAFKVNAHDDIGDKKFKMELGPAGSPDSIGILPKIGLDSPAIQRMWIHGKLSVSTDDRMEEQIALIMGQPAATAPKAYGIDAQGNEMLIEPNVKAAAANNSMVEKPCVECGKWDIDQSTGTRFIASGRVIQSYLEQLHGEPPLCPDHKSMAPLFSSRQVLNPDGSTAWAFDKAGIGKGSISN